MCRRACLIFVVALLVCGCSRRDAEPEPQGQETPPAPAERGEIKATQTATTVEGTQTQETEVEAEPNEARHPVVAVARRFLNAVARGQFDRAIALCVADSKFTKQGLAGLNQTFQLSGVQIGQAWLGTRQSIVITTPVTTRQGNATGFWGFTLVATEDGGWAVRDGTFLDERGAEFYFDQFLDAEPDAESIEL